LCGVLRDLPGRQALFVDRDGVLNEPVWDEHTQTRESPLAVVDVLLAPGAAEAVKTGVAAGMVVVVVSNQPSAAKGVVSRDVLEAVHQQVLKLLEAEGARVAASYICWHHPEGTDQALGHECDCRKPAPGLLLRAASDLNLDLAASWLVGDTDADVGAAAAAGLAGVVIVDHQGSAHRRGKISSAVPLHAATADEAVRRIVSLSQR
jgi:D-glycero-D-manno-heptose 1,7-bisphosphate phosphatase